MNLYPVESPACDAVLATAHPAHEDGGPCNGCALRAGTEASRSAVTGAMVRLCVEGNRKFHCHEHPGLCRGFIAAMNLRVTQPEEEKEWREFAGELADRLSDSIGRLVEEKANG